MLTLVLHVLVAEGYLVLPPLPHVDIPEITTGDVGIVLLVIGIVLIANRWFRRWRKQKGYRMILEDRNDKIHALLLDILQDGVDKAVLEERISMQEARRAFKMLAKKGFRDLVPKKAIASEVKSRLKTDRILRDKAKKEGKYVRPKIPGGPPTPIVKEKFSEKIGNTIAKLWRTAA